MGRRGHALIGCSDKNGAIAIKDITREAYTYKGCSVDQGLCAVYALTVSNRGDEGGSDETF